MNNSSIKISTVGTLRVEKDNQAFSGFITRKTELLFIYLALDPSPHSHEKLGNFLWGNQTQELMLNNLSKSSNNLK